MKQIQLTVVSTNRYYKNSIEKLLRRNDKYKVVPFDIEDIKRKKSFHIKLTTIVIVDFLKVNPTIVRSIKETIKAHSQAKMIIVSADDTVNYASIVYELGFNSHINHKDGIAELIKAVKIVGDGGTYISESMTLTFEKQLAKSKENQAYLSEREKELISFIKEGLTSKQIGDIIHRSHRTVDDLRKKLYTKLEVKNKAELLKLLADKLF